jgi:hypothetical protein
MRRRVILDLVAMGNAVKFRFGVILAIVLAGGMAAQPSLAGTSHRYRAAAKGDGAAHGSIAKDAHSTDTQKKDSSDADVAVAPSHPDLTMSKPSVPNANAKSGKPGTSQIRQRPAPAPSASRNSIGVILAPRKSITASSGESRGLPSPASGAPATGHHDDISGQPGQPDTGFRGPRPATTASIPSAGSPGPAVRSPSIQNRSKIDGSDLIRSSAAPSGLGGPAGVIAGINGTTLRPKR